MAAYYNENDKACAEWLRKLIGRSLIAPGDVDERSILEVRADDLRGYAQCHFFAGIGGWSYALRLAGWADDRFVWTGSCPCQPFSSAGAQRGHEDERHLWPAFFRLIRERRPATVFGEQVAGAAGLAWLDHVCADLEGEGYAAAAADLPASGVGAPHRRQRLFWVAHAVQGGCALERPEGLHDYWQSGDNATGRGPIGGMGDPECARLEGLAWNGDDGDKPGRLGARPHGSIAAAGANDPWADLEWLACSDGKARPTQPGLSPLAHGLSRGLVRGGDRSLAPDADQSAEARIMRLRGYGNAIVPALAAEFIAAVADLR